MNGLLLAYFVTCAVIIGCLALLILVGVAIRRQRNPQIERIDSPPAEVIDFSEALRVRDRTRRGPVTLAGPDSRERLPL